MTPKPLNFLPIIFQLLLEIIEISQRLHLYLSTSKHIYIYFEKALIKVIKYLFFL